MGEETPKRSEDAGRLREQISKRKPGTEENLRFVGPFDAIYHSHLRFRRIQDGRALCSFRIPPHLTDEDGNWQPGSIAALIDGVGALTVMSRVGFAKVSVEFDVSYFSPAKVDEVVEMDARVVERRGKELTAVAVEVRRKEGGDLVAVGRQWMSSGRSFGTQSARKRSSNTSRL